MKTNLKTLALIVISMVVLSSCFNQKKSIKVINPEIARYVSGFTSGAIGRKQSIRIELADQYGNPGGLDSTKDFYDIPDKKVLEGIFEFSPSVKGRAIWLNRRVIEFIPDEPLTPNQFYTVGFNLDKVANVDKEELKKFEFQFTSYPLSVSVETSGLLTYNSYQTEWMYLKGVVKTSDYADTGEIKKILNAEWSGKVQKIRWGRSTSDNRFEFYIDSIQRKAGKEVILLKWDGSSVGSFDRGSREIHVPSLGDFNVEEVKLVDKDDQHLELYFSDPLLSRQNLKGIVTLENVENLSYTIEGNVVKLFIDGRIEGTRKLKVNNSIKNYKNFNMNEAYETSIDFLPASPKVKLFGSGSILPNSGGLIFPFEAISLKKVDVRVMKIKENNVHQFLQVNNLDGRDELYRVSEKIAEKTIDLSYDKTKNLKQWNTHVIDLSKLINPEPGAIYRVSIRFKKDYAICNCDEDSEENTNQSSNANTNEITWNENAWNYWSFDDHYETWNYYYDDDYSPCDRQYYYGKAVNRNIVASDLGMIYKLDENKQSHAFINNMITTEPIANCKVEYFDFTKKVIASGTTDASGMLDLPLKSKPFLMIASYGKQKGYMKLQDAYANSVSKFEVDGELVQKGIKGFIYGERGVWRPGDSIYLSFMLEDKMNVLPGNYPVKFELRDPNDAIIYQTVNSNPVRGIYDFRTHTSTDGITGNYTAVTKVGNQTFYKSLKIETVKPNRLKINFEIPGDRITSNTKDTIGKIEVKWLHGAVAPNLKTKIEANLSGMHTTFKSYPDYIFDSPLRQYESEEITMFDGHLDKDGKANIKGRLNGTQRAAGMLRANFVTRVFEEGGDFSIDRYSVAYSPYKTYLGINVPALKSKNDILEAGSSYSLNIASVSESGSKVQVKKIEIKIYKIKWRWWYEQEEDNLSDYVARSSAMIYSDTVVETKNGLYTGKLNFSNEEYGRYLVVATDLEGGHQTGMVLTIDWPYWSRNNNTSNENAKMLNFSVDKTNYTTGERIKLTIPSQANGRALVSVENGSKIINKFWIRTNDKETRYEIMATPEMAPNAYIHVTLLQPHANTKNDLPIRMYGIVPINIIDPNTILTPVITSSEVWKPESKASIFVKESKGKAMTYTLAVVDEGLLDLTRFKTPEPWKAFYAKEALGVKTWDMYDHVIGAFSGKLDKLLSIGGDGEAVSGNGAKANRFKPMVRFIGPFHLSAGKSKTHKIDVPNYVGSVRVMVVAENNGSYGSAEKAVSVRKPLMVLATLPRVLGPGETVQLPVDVFAMEDHVKNVKITIETNDFLKVDGSPNDELIFNKKGDKVINFKLKVAERTGIASVRVTAISGIEKSFQDIEIDVRASNPKVVDSKEYTLGSGKSLNQAIDFRGLVGTNKLKVEVSRIPSIGLDKRLDYLIMYPHGCIEQTTSSVFPQLFVGKLMEMTEKQKDNLNKNIKAGIKRLQLFQTSSGGLSYWPGESETSDWGTNYAGHFIIEAEKSGYVLPPNFKNKWLAYQQNAAREWVLSANTYTHPHGSETYQHIQSYRLYTLALAGSPELGAMNRMREDRQLGSEAKWRLAAAYNLIGQTEVARQLVANLETNVKQYKELSYSYGSKFRDEAMILEVLSLLKQNDKANDLAISISKSLRSNSWMSTQETAYGLLAICTYANLRNSPAEMKYSYQISNGKSSIANSKKSINVVSFSENEIKDNEVFNLKNEGQSNLYVKVLVEGIPLVGDQKASSNHLSMSVVYKNMKGELISVDKLGQGTDFYAEISIKNPGSRGDLREMALNHIFPSGWEIRNTRMEDGNNLNPSIRYQDFRDDRVYSYYDLNNGNTKTIIVKLNATYLGRFYLPTIYSEAMYDQSINASIPGRWIEVVKPDNGVAVK